MLPSSDNSNDTQGVSNTTNTTTGDVAAVTTTMSQLEMMKAKLRTDVNLNIKSDVSTSSCDVREVVDTMQDQVRHLRRAVQHTIDLNKTQLLTSQQLDTASECKEEGGRELRRACYCQFFLSSV